MNRISLICCFIVGALSAFWIVSPSGTHNLTNSPSRLPAVHSFSFQMDVGSLQRENEISYAAAYNQVAADYEVKYGAGTMAQFRKESDFTLAVISNLGNSGTPEDDVFLGGLVNDPAIWTAYGDDKSAGDWVLLSPGLIPQLEKMRSMGFEPSSASPETLEELVGLYGPETLNKYYPNIASSRSLVTNESETQVLEQAAAVALETYRAEVIPKLIEADLEGLLDIDTCFAELQTDESQATDFCQAIYDFYKKIVPEKVEEVTEASGRPLKEFQARTAVYANCTAETFLSLSNKKIVNAYEKPSASLPMSTITLRKWIKQEGEADSSITIPLYKFYKAAKQFCNSKVILSRDPKKVKNHQKIFNMERVNFDELFLPLGTKARRAEAELPTSSVDEVSTGK